MIKIQSISDIITNSSSEVFIIDTNKPEVIEQLIRDICEVCSWDIEEMMCFATACEDGKIDGWDIDYNAGNLIIRSVSDNTIPYSLMKLIEYLHWENIPALQDVNINSINRHHLG